MAAKHGRAKNIAIKMRARVKGVLGGGDRTIDELRAIDKHIVIGKSITITPTPLSHGALS